MLEKARNNFKQLGIQRNYEFNRVDLNEGFQIENASVVVLNLTLQFVRPLHRDILIQRIISGLNEKGCLILVEKVLGNDSLFNRMLIKIEIAQKREALEKYSDSISG